MVYLPLNALETILQVPCKPQIKHFIINLISLIHDHLHLHTIIKNEPDLLQAHN